MIAIIAVSIGTILGLPTVIGSAYLLRWIHEQESPRMWVALTGAAIVGVALFLFTIESIAVLISNLWVTGSKLVASFGTKQEAKSQTSLVDATLLALVWLWVFTLPLMPLTTLLWYWWQKIWAKVVEPYSFDAQVRRATEQQALYEGNPAKPSFIKEDDLLPAQDNEIRLGIGNTTRHHEEGIVRRGRHYSLTNALLNEHIFILGTTGFGKTETLLRLIYEAAHNTQRKIFLIDGKGDVELALQVQQLLTPLRGEVPIFRLSDSYGVKSTPYNAFSGNGLAIVNRLVQLLGAASKNASPEVEFYNSIVRHFMHLACLTPQGAPKNLQELELRLLSKDKLQKLWANNTPEHKQASSVSQKELQGVLTRLLPVETELRPHIREDGFTLESVNAAIFSIDTQSYGDTAWRLMRLLIEDIKNYNVERKGLDEQALVVIDEFGTLSTDNITSLLMTARSFKTGIVLATQTTASLGDESVQMQILPTINTHILHRASSSEILSEMAGTEDQPEASIQIQNGAQTGLGSVRFQKAFKVHPDEVRRLQKGEVYLIRGPFATKLKIAGIDRPPVTLTRKEVPPKPPDRPPQSGDPKPPAKDRPTP